MVYDWSLHAHGLFLGKIYHLKSGAVWAGEVLSWGLGAYLILAYPSVTVKGLVKIGADQKAS